MSVGFEDKVLIGKYTEKVEDAVSVLVKEIEYGEPLPTAARPGTTVPKKSRVGIEKNQAEGWRWFLEHVLGMLDVAGRAVASCGGAYAEIFSCVCSGDKIYLRGPDSQRNRIQGRETSLPDRKDRCKKRAPGD